MDHGSIRLAFGVGWLATAAIVAARPMGDAKLVALVALILALWNLFRWYSLRFPPNPRPASGTNPLRRRDGERAEEYNPELDFTKRDGG